MFLILLPLSGFKDWSGLETFLPQWPPPCPSHCRPCLLSDLGGSRGIFYRSGRDHIRHARAHLELLERQRGDIGVPQGAEVVEAHVLEAPHSNCFRVLPEWLGRELVGCVNLEKLGLQSSGNRLLHVLVCRRESVRVNNIEFLSESRKRRGSQGIGLERRVDSLGGESLLDGLDEERGDFSAGSLLGLGGCREDGLGEELLAGLPPIRRFEGLGSG